MSKEISMELKLDMYHHGMYSMGIGTFGGQTNLWTEEDWIKAIGIWGTSLRDYETNTRIGFNPACMELGFKPFTCYKNGNAKYSFNTIQECKDYLGWTN